MKILTRNNKILIPNNNTTLPTPYFWLKGGEKMVFINGSLFSWNSQLNNITFTRNNSNELPKFGIREGRQFLSIVRPSFIFVSHPVNVNLRTSEFTCLLLIQSNGLSVANRTYSRPIFNRTEVFEGNNLFTLRGWNIYRYPDNWEFWTGAGAGQANWSITRSLSAPTGNWEIIAVRRDSTTSYIFVDGILKNSTTAQYSPIQSTSTQTFLLDGDNIHDVVYFNYALTNQEVLGWTNQLKFTLRGGKVLGV